MATLQINDPRLPRRFWDKVFPVEQGCWLWGGGLQKGYGELGFKIGRWTFPQRAHRLAYVAANGPLQKGVELDHLCRVRACVNPEHLEAVSCRENQRRGMSPSGLNARKTHCKRGHEFTAENTYTYQPKHKRWPMRSCRMCLREKERRRRRGGWEQLAAKVVDACRAAGVQI